MGSPWSTSRISEPFVTCPRKCTTYMMLVSLSQCNIYFCYYPFKIIKHYNLYEISAIVFITITKYIQDIFNCHLLNMGDNTISIIFFYTVQLLLKLKTFLIPLLPWFCKNLALDLLLPFNFWTTTCPEGIINQNDINIYSRGDN